MADPIYFGDGIKLACCPTTLESLYIAASGCCSNYYTAFLGGEQSYSIVYTLPTASGSSGQVLTTDNNGNLSWQNNSGGGGTGSPAGSDGYIQYNNGGSFGGASIVYWDDISHRLGIGTSSPNQTLEVAGTMRLTGSTGTSSSILGRSSVGDISSIAIGSGLSLSGNTLISSGGLPASGLTGQILAKNSGSNYDVSWVDNITAVQHMQQYIKNNQGATVSKGQAVYIDGADGTNATIKLAQADSEATSSKTLGLLEQNLANNAKGYVVTEGLLSGIDTSGANAAGDPVWLDPNNAGGLIFGLTNKPVAPAHLVYLGVVIRKNNVNGEIYVKVQNGYELQELHNVLIPSSVTNNDVLAYETSTSLWKNKSFTSLGLVSGTGTTNYIPKWNNGTSLANSVIFQSGTSVGIGTTTPLGQMHIVGSGTGSGSTALLIQDSNNVNIFNLTDNSNLTLGKTITLTANTPFSYLNNTATITNSISNNLGINGLLSNITIAGTSDASVSGAIRGTMLLTNTSASNIVHGGLFSARSSPGGAFNFLIGVGATVDMQSASIGTNAVGLNVTLSKQVGGTTSNVYGIRLADLINTVGTIVNTFGIYVGDITTGTQTNIPYSLYLSDANAKTYIAGPTSIGTTTLSSDRLDIQGTTASEGGQIGAELMTTGSGTNWTGTSFASGYTHTTGSIVALTSAVSVASASYYQVSYTITGRTAGTVNVSVGGVTSGAVSVSGSLAQSVTSATAVTVTPTTDFDGAIILSVKQITASAMATFALKNSSGTVVYEQRAGASNTNIFQGVGAGSLNTTGINNIFKGFEAGLNNTTGSDNTFIGRLSGKFNTTGSNNVFNGSSAGRSNTIGATNSFIGCNAGQNSTTGSGNVFIGSSAGLNNTSGAENISIGIDAGRFIANATAATTNVGCIALGGDTRTLLNGETNATVIGYKARGLGSNTTVIGSSATIQTWLGGKLSVGTTGNTAYLNVQGSGSTSATTSLLIQNSATTPLLTIKDDGAATFSAQTGTATTGTTNFVTLDHSIAASGAGNANFRPLNIGYTINNTGAQSGNTTGIFLNATATALGGMTHNLIEAQLGAMSIFKVNQNGACSTYFLDLAGNNQNKGLYMPAGGNTSILSNFNSVQLQAYNGTAYVTALFMSGGGVGEIRTNIGSVAAVASARLQVDSTTKGFLPPRMSSSNRDAISPIDGLEIYNNSINAKQVYSTGVTNEWKTVDTALQSLVATGGTLNILFKNGNVANVALNDSTIFTFSNAAVGVYIINLKQGVGGSFTVTWPTIKWAGGIPPTLTATAGKYDIITLIYDGINYYGTASLNF